MVDTSYLAQQVNNSIAQLHGLFDEIGVPDHEREARESEVCLLGRKVYRSSLT
jgi:protein regulator of cytokinesis 1